MVSHLSTSWGLGLTSEIRRVQVYLGGRVVRGWGGGGAWTASGRATKEKIQRKSDPHGAQSDKDTLKPGNKGSSYEEARTNGPIKSDHGLNGTTPPPPPLRTLHRRDTGKPYPSGGGARANPTTTSEGCVGRGLCKGRGTHNGGWGMRANLR